MDSTGELTTGQKFTNAQDLAAMFINDRRDTVLRNVVKKMMTCALGRGIEPYDRPAVDAILARMAKEGNSLQSLILGISESLPFQKRRGDRKAGK